MQHYTAFKQDVCSGGVKRSTQLINPLNTLSNTRSSRFTIVQNNNIAARILPARPLVISLLDYEQAENQQLSKESLFSNFTGTIKPGYPLVCISPCSRMHPLFNTVRSTCEKDGIIVWDNTETGSEATLIYG